MPEHSYTVMEPVLYSIERRKRETRDTFTLELVREDGGAPMRFWPGQFNMLYMFGVGEVPISISGDPLDEEKIVHTIRSYGSVTHKMAELRRGDMIGVRGPFGRPWPLDELEGGDVVLAAGGIGLAPLRPVIYSILGRWQRFGNVTLVYGERTPSDILFRTLLEQWRGRFDMKIEVTVDSAREGWRGSVGVVTTLIPGLRLDAERTQALICGPQIMMTHTIRALKDKGLTEERIHVSTERNMKCGAGICGHCQLGTVLVCRDGPVFRLSEIGTLLGKREL